MNPVKFLIVLELLQFSLAINVNAQQTINAAQPLNSKQQSIITLSALTAKGYLVQLQKAFNESLNAGLSVNEIKELIVHLSAYCGFPRSIRVSIP